MLEDGDIVALKSASHPGPTSVAAAGGAKTATILPITLGGWFTRHRAEETGVLDTDAVIQYQKIFVENQNETSTAIGCSVRLVNGLKALTTDGPIKILSNEPSTTKFVINGEDTDGDPNSDEIVSDPGVIVSGVTNFANRLFRVTARSTADDSLVTVEEDVEIYDDDDVLLGIIPGETTVPVPCSFAIGQLKLGLPNTTDDTQTSTNRNTAPSGITFTLAVSDDTKIWFRNDEMDSDLEPEVAQGIWGEWTEQPGQPADDVQIFLLVDYESGP